MHNHYLLVILAFCLSQGCPLAVKYWEDLKTSAGYPERGGQSTVCAPGVLGKGNIIKGKMSEHKRKKNLKKKKSWDIFIL